MGCTMGLAKCSKFVGPTVEACLISRRGVNVSDALACSLIVSTFIACLVTMRCRAPLGTGVNVDLGAAARVLGDVRFTRVSIPCLPTVVSLVVMSPAMSRVIAGTAPGVLFRVFRRCNRGVCFSLLFAVGFRAFMIGGAFVMRGMVRMGVSSITLCSCILTLCSAPS